MVSLGYGCMIGHEIGGVILMWVTEQRSVMKELGSGHLMARHMQRGLRRNSVKEKKKPWGGVCHSQGRIV